MRSCAIVIAVALWCASCGEGRVLHETRAWRFASRDASVVTPDAASPPAAPRPIAPLSGSVMTTPRVQLRWAPLSTSACGVLCRDPRCADVSRTFTSSAANVIEDLEAGTWWWRLDRCDGAARGPIWAIVVRASRSTQTARVGRHVFDANSDGVNDVAVGAPEMSEGRGRALVFLGRRGEPVGGAPQILQAHFTSNRAFGGAVVGAGDLDGDGYGDLSVVGRGVTQVHFGGPTAVNVEGQRVHSSAAASFFAGARQIEGAGDVDGDGYGDLVALRGGRVHLDWGGSDRLGSREPFGIDPPAEFATLTDLASLGDLDGDSRADFALGWASANERRVEVYFGGPVGPRGQPTILTSTRAGFGSSIRGLGDVNDDSFPDVVVGASGAVLVYLGSGSGLADRPSQVLALTSTSAIPRSSSGDFDADGWSDLVVTTTADRTIHVYPGSREGFKEPSSFEPDVLSADEGIDPRLGSGDDLDGDGVADIVIGLPRWDQNRGAALYYRGVPGRGLVFAGSIPRPDIGAFGAALARAEPQARR